MSPSGAFARPAHDHRSRRVAGPEPLPVPGTPFRAAGASATRGRLLPGPARALVCAALVSFLGVALASAGEAPRAASSGLPRIRVTPDGRGFITSGGRPFVPFGVNYFRPGTGWAPQVWKQFDAEATRRDFARLRELGANCVRVFLTFGSFYEQPGELRAEGLAKFDRFLELAEEAGIHVHPTGPDHWEGLPAWARGDRIADESVLVALEQFWARFAARYRGRGVLFAYDLLNEPEVRWDTPAMKAAWQAWLRDRYATPAAAQQAWGLAAAPPTWEAFSIPPKEEPPGRRLLDFQHCREAVAVAWTRRQVSAIKAVDPDALVTVGLIQWSVPVGIAGAWHYAAFRPAQVAPLLDFMEVHFYPLARGFYEYANPEDERRNLAYLDTVVRAVAGFGKPTVLAEFGWYGGGRLRLDQGRHPEATEAQQARWCRLAVELTAGRVCGWLNWSLHDHPGAGDVTELIGLLTADGREKEWGREFRALAQRLTGGVPPVRDLDAEVRPDWEQLIADGAARAAFQRRAMERFVAPPAVADSIGKP